MKKELETDRNKIIKQIARMDRDIIFAKKLKMQAKKIGDSSDIKRAKQTLKFVKFARKQLVKALAKVELLLK